jgi:hypothetical protein
MEDVADANAERNFRPIHVSEQKSGPMYLRRSAANQTYIHIYIKSRLRLGNAYHHSAENIQWRTFHLPVSYLKTKD